MAYCFSIKKATFDHAENVGITIHVQREGSKTELIPSLELQKHFFILLLQ